MTGFSATRPERAWVAALNRRQAVRSPQSKAGFSHCPRMSGTRWMAMTFWRCTQIVTNALVHRVVFDGKRTVAVEFSRQSGPSARRRSVCRQAANRRVSEAHCGGKRHQLRPIDPGNASARCGLCGVTHSPACGRASIRHPRGRMSRRSSEPPQMPQTHRPKPPNSKLCHRSTGFASLARRDTPSLARRPSFLRAFQSFPWRRRRSGYNSIEVRIRCFPVVTGYSGEGPFTEPIAATRLGSGNRSSCPHWHSRPLWRTRQGARQRHPRPGEEQNPLSCKYGPLSAVRAEGYTQFLGSIRPANWHPIGTPGTVGPQWLPWGIREPGRGCFSVSALLARKLRLIYSHAGVKSYPDEDRSIDEFDIGHSLHSHRRGRGQKAGSS